MATNELDRAAPTLRVETKTPRCRPKLSILLVLVGIALVFEVLGWIFVGQSFLSTRSA